MQRPSLHVDPLMTSEQSDANEQLSPSSAIKYMLYYLIDDSLP